jgi:hypothetical protein
MFILTKVADLVQIAPDDFRKQSHIAIEDNINSKYANKVGLGLSLQHISVLSDPCLVGSTKDWTLYLPLGYTMDIRGLDRAGRWDGQRQRYESCRVFDCMLPVLMMLRSRVPRGGVQAVQGRGHRGTHYGPVTRGDKPSVYPVWLSSHRWY